MAEKQASQAPPPDAERQPLVQMSNNGMAHGHDKSSVA